MLAPGGRMVLVGSAGATVAVGKNRGLPRGWSMTAPFWGPRADLEEVIGLAVAGRLGARTETWELDRATEAYDRLRQGRINGRAVVRPAKHSAIQQGAPS
jgi:alcohol dehydrogenase, propanol-preferring